MMPRFLLLLSLLCASTLQAEDPPATAEKKPLGPGISLEMRYVTLPRALALPLLPRLRSAHPADRARAFAELEALLTEGKANLLAWPMLTTHGPRVVHDETEQLSVATAFITPEETHLLSDHDGNLTTQPEEKTKTLAQPVAASFEARSIGFDLEAEPAPGYEAAGPFTISIFAQHTRLQGMDHLVSEHQFVTEGRVEKLVQEQPRFHVMKVQAMLTFAPGVPQLIGVFQVPGESGEMELFLMSADQAR